MKKKVKKPPPKFPNISNSSFWLNVPLKKNYNNTVCFSSMWQNKWHNITKKELLRTYWEKAAALAAGRNTGGSGWRARWREGLQSSPITITVETREKCTTLLKTQAPTELTYDKYCCRALDTCAMLPKQLSGCNKSKTWELICVFVRKVELYRFLFS